MGYVGNQTTTAFTSMDKQDITGDGTPNYTLSHAVANSNEIEVFVNNVRQESGVAYTTNGTALNMTGNVASTDSFYVVFQGKAVGTIVPQDGSVTSAKLDTNIAFSGNATFADNGKAIFGSGNDLSVFHDGSHSYVSDAGTGNLQLSTNGTAIKMLRGNGEVLSSFNIGGSVDLYHSNAKKFETTASGINVTGNIEVYNDDVDGYIWFHDTGTRSWSLGSDQSTGNFAITNVQGLASGHKLQIDSSGNVLIGTTSTTSNERVRISNGNDTRAISFQSASAAECGYIYINGGGTSVTYSTSSDYRLKENVTVITNATDRLKQLNPVRFNFIADADTTVDGFLAHEAQAVVPEAVTGTHNEVNSDGNDVYQGIDQSKLVPLLTAAIQEQQAAIEALTARVTALEAE